MVLVRSTLDVHEAKEHFSYTSATVHLPNARAKEE